MTVIWGLDLHDMQWSKFKSSYMFKNTDYHMRRTKFIIYQCAMIFLVVSESLGTAVLSDYLNQQEALQQQFPGIDVFNNDYIGIASYNIFVGIFAAIVFGAAFFLDLFWPARYEPRWVQNIWMGGAIFASIAALGDALAYTIILALHSQKISNYNADNAALVEALRMSRSKTPVSYRNSGRAVASVVFLWVGWACAVASTIVMFFYYRHYRKHGPKSTHVQETEDAKFERGPESETQMKLSKAAYPAESQTSAAGHTPNHYMVTDDRPVQE